MKVFGNDISQANRTHVNSTLARLKKVGLVESYKHGYWQKLKHKGMVKTVERGTWQLI